MCCHELDPFLPSRLRPVSSVGSFIERTGTRTERQLERKDLRTVSSCQKYDHKEDDFFSVMGSWMEGLCLGLRNPFFLMMDGRKQRQLRASVAFLERRPH